MNVYIIHYTDTDGANEIVGEGAYATEEQALKAASGLAEEMISEAYAGEGVTAERYDLSGTSPVISLKSPEGWMTEQWEVYCLPVVSAGSEPSS